MSKKESPGAPKPTVESTSCPAHAHRDAWLATLEVALGLASLCPCVALWGL